MNNFIEVHSIVNNTQFIVNVAHIASVHMCSEATIAKHGYKAHITMSNHAGDDSFSVKESYDEIIEKINCCSSTMIIK